ncbi:AI-2E family transporter [Candidatus Uhrbacteria bacterium]|jgi:predicted PurR-regulated permease PerM|nr:AI-2E family transporter [Candidatus Uhrbacteria bacterium]MBT7717011.1 AI-2E family transporter [Candidatus Uhrbacteria bacterium]
MTKVKPSIAHIRWFFIVASVIVLYLYWQVIAPFALVLVTAGVFAIILSPIEIRLRKLVRSKKLSAFIMLLAVLVIVVGPLFGVAALMVQQASDVVEITISQDTIIEGFRESTSSVYNVLPKALQDEVRSIDLVELGRAAATWAAENVASILSSTAKILIHVMIFFIALFYFLHDREEIYILALDISPFKDSLDAKILKRISNTVRSVVFGALVVAVVQATLATIGMTIFGVPGAILWGALVIIASQVPMVGTSIILVPAIIYLLIIGQPWAALGLLIWSVVAVSTVDNLISPFIVGSKTHMNQLLILISILGGLQWLGPIGFIIGPTILAAVMVVVELYRNGILDRGR